MSWLFGINKNQGLPDNPPQFPTAPPSGDGGKDQDGQSKGSSGGAFSGGSKMEAYKFDSTALERAAKAARDLETSSKL